MTYIALDLQYRPLPPVWTCRHLKLRRGSPGGGFYASCAIGGAAARIVYGASIEGERVAFMKRIRGESMAISTPLLQELWTLKGAEMLATRRGDHENSAKIGEQLKEVGLRFNAALEEHFEAYEEEGAGLGIEVAALAAMSESYVEYMIASGSTVNSWAVPVEILARFPEDVRRLLRSDEIPTQTSQSPERAS